MARADIRQGYKDQAWFDNNPIVVLKEGQIVHLAQTGKYKVGDGVTLLQSLQFLGKGVRIDSVTTTASATPNADTTDQYNIGQLAEGVNFLPPSGTPGDGQILIIRIKGDGFTHAVSFDPAYRFSTDLPAPTQIVTPYEMYLGFKYNLSALKWDNLAQLTNL